MKKSISLIGLVLAFCLAPTAVFAHGCGNARYSGTKYYQCNVANCNLTGRHYHNGICYNGHTAYDGHSYHQNCALQNCTKLGIHYHTQY